MVAQTATAPAGPAKGTAPPPPRQAFPVGVLRSENPDYDQSKLQSVTGAQQMPNYVLEPTGWLRGIWYQFDMLTSANAAAVTYQPDGPWSAIQKVTLKDTGNREVFGPIGGYDWMTVNKYGAYQNIGDPRSDLSFTVTGTAVATGGSFSFVLYLPLELVVRDSLGVVENKSTSSAWKVELWLDSGATAGPLYLLAPTTPGTMRVRATTDNYTEPSAADEHGRPYSQTPPNPGTLQYWVSENAPLPAGTASYNLDNGIGFSIRNIVYKFIGTATAARNATSDAAWPDPTTLTYGKVQLFQRYKNLWISKLGRAFGDQTPGVTTAAGVTTANVDVAGGRENSVFPVWFTDDFAIQPGAELRNGYLVTKQGTVLKLKGSFGVAGNLFACINYVIPPNNDPGSLRAGS
jgi:hypothetical protein